MKETLVILKLKSKIITSRSKIKNKIRKSKVLSINEYSLKKLLKSQSNAVNTKENISKTEESKEIFLKSKEKISKILLLNRIS